MNLKKIIREEIDDMFLNFHAIDAKELKQHIKDMDLKSIAPFKRVDGNLNLMGTSIHSMGSIEEVTGYLYLEETPIESLGKLQSVGRDLNLYETPIAKTHTEEQIRAMVDVGRDIYLR